ncbi:protein terminal ear1 [Cynara cardunculus var. scolymus]|uniref:protein terminal ear1 n=1 Tax=Cynara cardunculus var. scolymus TaxID=59895 RepID=UPI000D62987D|nr:protein terminal ear1 [Cynara cardunculus var. scolymus]
MGDPGFGRFPITLNPTAKEFRPAVPYTQNGDLLLPRLFYSYPYNFPPSPPSAAAVMVSGPHPTLPPPSPVPTRALLLSSVPTDVSESTVRRELEVFGDVRAVQMERLRDGIVTVHFYDLRQAAEALKEIQEQHMQQQFRLRKHFDGIMLSSPVNPPEPYIHHSPPLPPPAHGLLSGRAIWAQFTFPVAAGLPDGYNQGTVVIFNLDSTVSIGKLTEIFESFGCIKEFRESPLKKNQKTVEFYDTRNAAKAVAAVNGQEIDGKVVVVEFSRLGGGQKYNYKQNKFHPINSGGVPPLHINVTRKFLPAPIVPYRPQPPPSPPHYGKDRSQSPEQQGRWVGGGGGCNGGRNKIFKGSRYSREKSDPRFLIKEDGTISSFQDSRTTVMIKNIPNKYSQKLLLNMLDNHCIHCNEQMEAAGGDQPPSSYDFVYLPIDFVNKCNVGYGFVNMTSPEAARRLYTAFHHQNWEVFNSKKICEVSYARLQGLEALKEHFKNSKFPREAEEYMPVVFTPPRDGRTVTEPMPIVGCSSTVTVTSPPPSSSSEVGGDDSTDGRSFLDGNVLVEDVKCDDGNGVTAATTTSTAANGGD